MDEIYLSDDKKKRRHCARHYFLRMKHPFDRTPHCMQLGHVEEINRRFPSLDNENPLKYLDALMFAQQNSITEEMTFSMRRPISDFLNRSPSIIIVVESFLSKTMPPTIKIGRCGNGSRITENGSRYSICRHIRQSSTQPNRFGSTQERSGHIIDTSVPTPRSLKH